MPSRIRSRTDRRLSTYRPPYVSQIRITILSPTEARHNVDANYEGIDPPLTPLGEMRACEMRLHFHQNRPDLVVVAPHTRALKTAQLALDLGSEPAMPAHVWPALREPYLGSRNVCRSREDLQAQFPGFQFEACAGYGEEALTRNTEDRAESVRRRLKANGRVYRHICVVADKDFISQLVKPPMFRLGTYAQFIFVEGDEIERERYGFNPMVGSWQDYGPTLLKKVELSNPADLAQLGWPFLGESWELEVV